MAQHHVWTSGPHRLSSRLPSSQLEAFNVNERLDKDKSMTGFKSRSQTKICPEILLEKWDTTYFETFIRYFVFK